MITLIVPKKGIFCDKLIVFFYMQYILAWVYFA